MRIRTAHARDAQSIAKLHATSWRTAYRGMLSDAYLDGDILADRQALWAERFAEPKANQHVVVAEARGELAGFACAFGEHDPQWGTLLENLHVAPTLKRTGIGSLLVQEVARWSLGYQPNSSMHLWVLQTNAIAQAFYTKKGAIAVERSTWLAPDGSNVPQLRYAWLALHSLANENHM